MRLLHVVAFLKKLRWLTYFENATACSKRMRKTLVATQLNNTAILTISICSITSCNSKETQTYNHQ